jgi:hypothetical protein
MKVISSRRFVVAVALVIAALAGAVLRSFSAPQSTPYYLGTLFMVMWIPIVGNIIIFFAKKRRPVVPLPLTFSSSMPFVSHVVVEITFNLAQELELPKREEDGNLQCLFVTGAEGFSARLSLQEPLTPGEALGAEAQFLSPAVALPKFPVGSTFQLIQGRSGIGTGHVLSLSPIAQPTLAPTSEATA